MLRLAREKPRLHAAWLRTRSGTRRDGGMDGETVNASPRPASPAKPVRERDQTAGGESGDDKTAAEETTPHKASILLANQHTAMAETPAAPVPAPGPNSSVCAITAAAGSESSSGAWLAASVDTVWPLPPTQPLTDSASDGLPNSSEGTRGGKREHSSEWGGGGPEAPEGSPERQIVRFSLQVTQEPRPPSSPTRQSANMKV